MPRRASTQTLPPASAPNAGAGSQGAYLRIGPMMAIPVLMKDLGGDVAELHEQFGLSRGYFDNPENTLPLNWSMSAGAMSLATRTSGSSLPCAAT